jgi:apolipoprotein D and lipocalin family protein
MKLVCTGLIFLIFSTVAAAGVDVPGLRTVPKVDLARYLGTWYEIARYPNSFQKECDQATAQYSLRDDGDIDVLNTCVRKDNKKLDEAHGVAHVEDPLTNAKLTVTFLPGWLRWTGIGVGKYWIIDLGSEYEYAVVSEPKRKYLWILSRTPTSTKLRNTESVLSS